MEDAATAEISRAQLWQWVNRTVKLDDGRAMSESLYKTLKEEEMTKLAGLKNLERASELLDSLVLQSEFKEFLTLPAYEIL